MSLTRPDLQLARWLAAAARRLVRDERGSVLVITALLLPAQMGLLGLMLDGAMLFAAQRELQDAADGAALYGAMQVDLAQFEQNGQWKIAELGNMAGARTGPDAAAEVCAAYGADCSYEIPPGNQGRVMRVTASRTAATLFIHLIVGQQTVNLEARATAVLVPGY
jgi:Flp pilus assembly protein TadG